MAHALSNTFLGFNPTATFNKLAAAYKTARARRAIYNETYAELANLGDRELADIGVARSDIREIARQHAATEL